MSGKKFTDALKGFDRDHFDLPDGRRWTSSRPSPRAASTRASTSRSGSGSIPARPTRWSAARSPCRPARARTSVSLCSPPARPPTRPVRAGADIVGADDLAAQIEAGKFDFDVAIANHAGHDAARRPSRSGPRPGRGLMPNPKTGTVTNDVGRAVSEFKGGKVEYRTDRYGNVHVPLGKVSFEPAALETPTSAPSSTSCSVPTGVCEGSLPAQDHRVVDEGPRRPCEYRAGLLSRDRLSRRRPAAGIPTAGDIALSPRISLVSGVRSRFSVPRGRWRATSTTTTV